MLTTLIVVTILQYTNICIYHCVCTLERNRMLNVNYISKHFEGWNEGIVKESLIRLFMGEKSVDSP